jgi:hypothetical protein
MDFVVYRHGIYALAAAAVVLFAFTDRAFADFRRLGEAVTIPYTAPHPQPVKLDALASRLGDTNAIGLLAKLELKRSLDALLGDFQLFHAGEADHNLDVLKRRFDTLFARTLSMIRHGDPRLGRELLVSRAAFWTILADPVAFGRTLIGAQTDTDLDAN